MSDASKGSVLDPGFVAMLCCPLTHSKVHQEGDYLVAEVGGLRYPIRDGIPVMLTEEAELPPQFKSLAELKAHLHNTLSR